MPYDHTSLFPFVIPQANTSGAINLLSTIFALSTKLGSAVSFLCDTVMFPSLACNTLSTFRQKIEAGWMLPCTMSLFSRYTSASKMSRCLYKVTHVIMIHMYRHDNNMNYDVTYVLLRSYCPFSVRKCSNVAFPLFSNTIHTNLNCFNP